MRYRPEIDGMRTITVLSVIFYHANFSMFSGGFIGVDIFFVISGFLITKVIRKEILVDNFSFLNFYEKRIRRIFPALFFVVLSSLIISAYVLPPVDAKHFFQSMFATITFSSNFLFWIQSGDYFDVGSIYKPLHHTWSLSLEEQFYLFHPFLLIFISKLKDYKQLIIIVLSIFISLTFSHFYLNHDLKGNFYLLPFRMWELFAGALLAFINLDKIRNKFSNMQQDIFACIGIAIVFISIFSFNPKTLHPSFITIAPILGSCIIIIFSTTKGLSGKLLSNKLSVYIGLISYSLYLWHYPIFVFSRFILIKNPSSEIYIFLIILSFIASIFSYHYIETPFRSKIKFNFRSIILTSSVFSLIFLLVGFLGHIYDGFPNRFSKEFHNIIEVQETGMKNKYGCHGVDPDSLCIIGDLNQKPNWAILGDSHAGSISSVFGDYLSERRESAYQLTQGGCVYALDLYKGFDNPEFCNELNYKIREIIINNDISNIVIYGRYVRYLYKTGFNNHEGGKEFDIEDSYFYSSLNDNDEKRISKVLESYKYSIEELLLNGKKIFLIYPSPEMGWHVPRQVFKNILYGKGNSSIRYDLFNIRSEPVIDIFNKIIPNENLVKIDPTDIFCNISTFNRCEALINDSLLYFDDDHVSEYGAKLIIENLFSKLK